MKLFFVLLFTLTMYSQQYVDTLYNGVMLPKGSKYVRGKIEEVDYTRPPFIYIKVKNDTTGQVYDLRTRKYIRGQKEFFIQGDTLNVMPPPLHVTNFWVADSIMYVETSEPVMITLYNRNHKWKGTGTPWGKRNLQNTNGYQSAQAFAFQHRWFTTRTIIEYKYTQPTPDDWDFALELKPIRTGIPYWSDWMHFRTFYFTMYEHL
jgi:hypothetical protein